MKNKKTPAGFTMDDKELTLSIGSLLGKGESEISARPAPPLPPKPAMPDLKDPESAVASFAQVTLHRESAGRGGKTVTLVAVKPPQPPAALEALAKALRKGLGCGSHVEKGKDGEKIVLQGDIPDRAQEWFVKKGARKVVRGN